MLRRYLQTVPYRSRPAFYYESLYSFGRGVFLALWPLSLVVLKTVLDGKVWHLSAIACVWGFSGLLAPWWAYLARRVEMRLLVVWPNVLAAACLAGVFVARDPTSFVVVVALAFFIGTPTRVAEMSLYRVLYPITHRSLAVGWLKGVAFVGGSLTTLAGAWIIAAHGSWYWCVYAGAGVFLLISAWSYFQIRVPKSGSYLSTDPMSPRRALAQALVTLAADRRFLVYQSSFFISGFGNHLSLVLVAEVMRERLSAPALALGGAVAVLPYILQAVAAPFWGRFLDRVSPMAGRAVLSIFTIGAFSLYCYGGVALRLWPFLAGSLLQGVGQSGNQINWTTGSLYFADRRQVPMYNSVHVVLTGIRGLIAPLLGAWLFSQIGLGPWLFGISALLGAVGVAGMLQLALTDPGPQEQGEDQPEAAAQPISV